MLNDLVLTPPVAFSILLVVLALFALAAKGLQTKSNPTGGKGEPYASGEQVTTGRIQPGYNFFHIAFAFTILEVTALLLGTVVPGAGWLAGPVLAIVVLSLIILFRKD